MSGEGRIVCSDAIVGSSLLSGLLAGLLAREHSRNVCLIVDPSIQHRLSREINISVDCITRPETLEMLTHLQVEALRLLARIGGTRAIRGINPVFSSAAGAGADALAHMYHVARGCGYEVEDITLAQLPHIKAALRIRGAKCVERRVFWMALERWLLAGGVKIVKNTDLGLSFKRDGSGTVAGADITVEFERLIFGDEQALGRFARPGSLASHFAATQITAMLSEPDDRLKERVVLGPEDEFCAFGTREGLFEILARGSPNDLGMQVGRFVPDAHLLRRAGQSTFKTVRTVDGAPMLGRLGRGGGWAVAGFGRAGLFMAPAIARYLAGRPRPLEEEYFLARSADSSRKSAWISEFGILPKEGR